MCKYLVDVCASNKSFDVAIGKIKRIYSDNCEKLTNSKLCINDHVVIVMQYDHDMIVQYQNSMKHYIVHPEYIFKYSYNTALIARAVPLIMLSPIITYIYDTFLETTTSANNVHVNGDANALSVLYKYMRAKSFSCHHVSSTSQDDVSIYISESLCYVSKGTAQQCYFDLSKYSLLHYFTLDFIQRTFNHFMKENLLCDVIHCDAYEHTRECKTSRFFHIIDFSY